MSQVFIINFLVVSLLIGLALQLFISRLFDKKIERIFATGLLFILILIFADVADYHFQEQSTLNNLRYVSSTIGYVMRPALVAILISILLRKKKTYFLLWLPIIIEAILVITSYYTHLIFYFDGSNVFHRGPIGYIVHITGAVYIIVLVIIAIEMYKNTDKLEILTLFYIVILCTLATIFESFFGYKFILPAAMTISCAIYYIYLYTQIYKIDVLTGVLNRHTFYKDTQALLSTKMAIISVDLNDLKKLNDFEGHAAGDIALCALANIMVTVSNKKFKVYRTGGDEFIVVGINQTAETAQTFIDNVNVELKKTRYIASFGCSIYSPKDNFEDVCVKSDIEMYKNKKILKAEKMACIDINIEN